jgi:hypothetical protein
LRRARYAATFLALLAGGRRRLGFSSGIPHPWLGAPFFALPSKGAPRFGRTGAVHHPRPFQGLLWNSSPSFEGEQVNPLLEKGAANALLIIERWAKANERCHGLAFCLGG